MPSPRRPPSHPAGTGARSSWFTRLAKRTARLSGRPITFGAAVGIIVLWAVLGPVFGFSDTWQLVINTGTTIVTFLMVFLIQNTQNRDTGAIQIKLDELIRATSRARNTVLDLEELDEEVLDELREHYEKLAKRARDHADVRRQGRAKGGSVAAATGAGGQQPLDEAQHGQHGQREQRDRQGEQVVAEPDRHSDHRDHQQ